MSDTTVTVSTRMSVIECASCAMAFAVPERFQSDRREDHRSFWCPNGHSNVYHALSPEERLQREVNDLKTRLTHARDEARQERGYRQSEERAHAATKGHLTRLRNRVQHGVCTQCHRSFQNLARHMATKHPEEGRDG